MALTKGVHHIALKAKGVAAFEKTMHFYTELLGMPLVRTWGSGEDLGAMVAIGNGSMMELFSNGPDELGAGAIRHMAFAVDDVDACVKAVRDAGYEITIEPKDIVIGSVPPLPARIAFCIGPCGEEIEFFCEAN